MHLKILITNRGLCYQVQDDFVRGEKSIVMENARGPQMHFPLKTRVYIETTEDSMMPLDLRVFIHSCLNGTDSTGQETGG